MTCISTTDFLITPKLTMARDEFTEFFFFRSLSPVEVKSSTLSRLAVNPATSSSVTSPGDHGDVAPVVHKSDQSIVENPPR